METQITVKKKGRIRSKLEKMYIAASSALMVGVMASVPAFADAPDNAQANKAIKELLKIIGDVGFYVGIGLLAFGIYEIVMSVIQSQPEAKTKGITLGVVGAILMGLGGILGNFDFGI